MKGKRVITVTMTAQVELDDVEFETTEQWDQLYHKSKDFYASNAEAIEGVIRQNLPFLKDGLDFGSYHHDIILDTESEKELESLREEEYQKWESQMDKIAEITKELGSKEAIYSMDYDAFIEDREFSEGVCKFIYEGGWDDRETVEGPIVEHPTFRDVFMAADECVQKSNDKHHIFLESARYSHTEYYDNPVGIKVYKFGFGS